MSRNSEREHARVSQAIEAYILPVVEGQDDGRPLSANSVAKVLHISRMTLRRHGMGARLEFALSLRARPDARQSSQLEGLRRRLIVAEKERDEWCLLYESMLENSRVGSSRTLFARLGLPLMVLNPRFGELIEFV